MTLFVLSLNQFNAVLIVERAWQVPMILFYTLPSVMSSAMALCYHFAFAELLLVGALIVLGAIIVQAETNFSFLSFPTAESFLVLNDTMHVPWNSSFLLNVQGARVSSSCGRLLYNEKIKMKDLASGAVASFHTAFTFQINGPNLKFVAPEVYYHGDGLAFTFVRSITLSDAVESGSELCLLDRAIDGNIDPLFAVEFDTYKTHWFGDISDSHVGVNINSMRSIWSYNLCDGSKNREYCSYLANGGYFTAWIDYYNTSQILQVFLARGSLPDEISEKPPKPLIEANISKFMPLANLVDEFMYVGFSSGTGVHWEVHEIKSWTFSSSMTKQETVVLSGIPSSGRSPVKKIIIGVSVAGGIVLLASWKVLRGPLKTPTYSQISSELQPLNYGLEAFRIFISHTGGPNGSEKNFPINLSKALKDYAEKNKCNYEVFIDRKMEKGTKFPEEILRQIAMTHLGIVVVTKEFFKNKWPMIELAKFVEFYKPPEVLILPLFYKMKPAEVRSHLEKKFWERFWTQMSSPNHPIDLEKYRNAVQTLCNINGVEYNFSNDSYDAEYIEQILKEVDKIYGKKKSKSSQERILVLRDFFGRRGGEEKEP